MRSATGRPVTTYVADLADDEATHKLGRTLADAHRDATLLVNNAGRRAQRDLRAGQRGGVRLADGDQFPGGGDADPRARTGAAGQPGSHLVNISSLFGLIAPAGQVAYATSKFAVRGFTEGLRHELAGAVGVTVVHPGGIRTRIAETARVAAAAAADEAEDRSKFSRLLSFPPERAAELIVTAVQKRRPRLLIAFSARFPDLLARLAPARYPAMLAAAQRAMERRG